MTLHCTECYEKDYGHYQKADFNAYGTSLCTDHYITKRDQHDQNIQPQQTKCQCGHTYQKHFNTYNGLQHAGCKNCTCQKWKKP